MTETPTLDRAAAHRHFSAACFNETWALLDKANRTPEENRQMIATAWASLYHWTQRPDCTSQHLSVGYWQVSRVHAVLNLAQEARRYAEVCDAYSHDLPPFYRGYAQEALARAAALTGDTVRAE